MNRSDVSSTSALRRKQTHLRHLWRLWKRQATLAQRGSSREPLYSRPHRGFRLGNCGGVITRRCRGDLYLPNFDTNRKLAMKHAHHNFSKGDRVKVRSTSGISGVTHLEGTATIVGIDPAFEDQYFVQFDDRAAPAAQSLRRSEPAG